MDENITPERATPRIIGGLFLTVMNSWWALGVIAEDTLRRGSQRVFGPSPELLPEWMMNSIPVCLAIQLAISVYWIANVREKRWRLATVLLPLWLIATMVAQTRFG